MAPLKSFERFFLAFRVPLPDCVRMNWMWLAFRFINPFVSDSIFNHKLKNAVVPFAIQLWWKQVLTSLSVWGILPWKRPTNLTTDYLHNFAFSSHALFPSDSDNFLFSRWVTTTCMMDYQTVAVADKFGNISMVRLGQNVNDNIDDDPTGETFIWNELIFSNSL